jgi:hypothetical protein
VPDNDLPYSQPTPHHIDVDAVIRRSRRRRVPRQLGVAFVSVLAVAGVFSGAVFGLGALSGATSSGGSASSGAAATRAPSVVPSAESSPPDPNLLDKNGPAVCGYSLPTVGTQPDGLIAEATRVSTNGPTLHFVFTLTNTGSTTITGSAGVPILVLVRNGIVIDKTIVNGPPRGAKLKMAPGQIVSYPLNWSPSVCKRGDNSASPGADALPSGSYQVYAEIQVLSTNSSETVTGPPTTVKFH